MRSTTAVPLLALVGSAFAFSNPYASLHLLKRQSASDLSSATAAAETLATDAVTAISNGTCSTECTGMITSLTTCSTQSTEEAIAVCACGTDVVATITSCGTCLGGDDETSASQIATLCTDNAALISNAASPSGSATSALATAAAASVTTSSAAAAASTSSTSTSGASSFALSGVAAVAAVGAAVMAL